MYQWGYLWFFPFYHFQFVYFLLTKFAKKVRETITWDRLSNIRQTIQHPTDYRCTNKWPLIFQLRIVLSLILYSLKLISATLLEKGGQINCYIWYTRYLDITMITMFTIPCLLHICISIIFYDCAFTHSMIFTFEDIWQFFFQIFISMLIANRILTQCSVCILGISHLSVQKKPRSWAEQSDHALIYCVQPPTLEYTDQYWLSVRYSFLQNLILTFLATSVWL